MKTTSESLMNWRRFWSRRSKGLGPRQVRFVVHYLHDSLGKATRQQLAKLNLRVWQAEDPLTCVARGVGVVLEDFNHMRHYLVSLDRGSTRHRV